MTAAMEQLVAHTILQGSDAMFGRFLDVTAGAQQRFEQADWQAVHQAMKNRISFYQKHVSLVTNQIQIMLGRKYANRQFLMAVKAEYEDLLLDYPRYDIAESFFNSVYCRIFEHRNIEHEKLFVRSSQQGRIPTYPAGISKHYVINGDLAPALERIIDDTPFHIPWENRERDIASLAFSVLEQVPNCQEVESHIEMVKEPFFRNKAAYLVGKIHQEGHEITPIVIPLLNREGKALYVDACICDSREMSIIFGFARSYFMVYCSAPSILVAFLRDLMPKKTLAELYTAIGCQKHGKTELYREYLNHIESSDDLFVLAPGIKGMVMSVFTLPSYDFVFKIIKDKFAPQKEITHATVKEKYKLVKEHDRVGRMADTLEYRNFVFDRHRFSQELIDELLAVAPSNIELKDDKVLIKHLYMERRMTPLNLYLESANEAERQHAVRDYGNALKQLAAANIFPGDMLLKNFGVTRHKRVVFYDYDEISYMNEVNFRDIPEPKTPEQEMASEPWYSVGPNDVFPEEFRTFLFVDRHTRDLFAIDHEDLFTSALWKQLQAQVQQGQVTDVYPYNEAFRFSG
ncbi:bifunctional isocitrate dehydrogenase kinase/phosphatase [Thaumasiovibrio subtropicus]|uniref:bifunctional isocitrate dehydrogenase kinase/phosphatase n=1 Tax=Thaumasiovibrio subtropicus TaxID=1891207 RepID=UPI000B35E8D8|nr:bifunctional isocitrate dehydrogenase kinase/phosphatase [Thaumasiovibrio subtropicus]